MSKLILEYYRTSCWQRHS